MEITENYPYIFKEEVVRVEFPKYYNSNNSAIVLISWDKKYKMSTPVFVATTKVEHYEIAENEVIIKDYNENIGILNFLIKNHFINKPYKTVNLGHNKLYVCQIKTNNHI